MTSEENMRESGQTLLEFATEYHQRLRNICDRLTGEARTDRLERFLRVLRENEELMKETLAAGKEQAKETTRERIFRYTPQESPLELARAAELGPDMSADEAMKRVLELQNRVVSWYEQLATQAPALGVEEDLRQLAELERNSAKKLAACLQQYS